MNLPAGTLLQGGKYTIVRFISNGGFGCTYEAEHTMLEKRVAIKEFFVEDFCNRDGLTFHVTVGTLSKKGLVDKIKKKFIDEARALCKLQHPGIVSVSDVFEENNTAYYVMDYIDGQSLNDLIKKQGALPEATAVKYIRQVADALRYVHSQNRLHLDIKPGNIMLGKDGRVILIDFGASKQYDEQDGENNSTLMGKTPGYAPLEQMGNDVVKFLPSTDIYALGATLYKLLTGETPLSASLLASGDGELAPLPNTISPATRQAVARAMEINKKKRVQSIDEFLAILDGSGAIDHDADKTDVVGGARVASESTVAEGKPYKDNFIDKKPSKKNPEFPVAPVAPAAPTTPITPTTPETPATPDAKKPRKGKGVWVFLLMVLLLGAGGWFYLQNKELFSRTESEPQSQQDEDRLSHNTEEATKVERDNKDVTPIVAEIEAVEAVEEEEEEEILEEPEVLDPADAVVEDAVKDAVNKAFAKEAKTEEKTVAEAPSTRAGYSFGKGTSKSATQPTASDLYQKGKKCYKAGNYTEAVSLYQQAANQGYAKAQCDLGWCYENAKGVARDYTQAVSWYLKAANQGLADAQNNLGACYFHGRGVKKDMKQAASWYLEAANQGNVNAQYSLGYCYEKGHGVNQDWNRAAYWYLQAAEKGNTNAQSNIASCYEKGNGVEKDVDQAIYWYRKAAEKGNADAQKRLKKLEGKKK